LRHRAPRPRGGGGAAARDRAPSRRWHDGAVPDPVRRPARSGRRGGGRGGRRRGGGRGAGAGADGAAPDHAAVVGGTGTPGPGPAGGEIPARWATWADSLVMVGQLIPWRRAARRIEPAIASS